MEGELSDFENLSQAEVAGLTIAESPSFGPLSFPDRLSETPRNHSAIRSSHKVSFESHLGEERLPSDEELLTIRCQLAPGKPDDACGETRVASTAVALGAEDGIEEADWFEMALQAETPRPRPVTSTVTNSWGEDEEEPDEDASEDESSEEDEDPDPFEDFDEDDFDDDFDDDFEEELEDEYEIEPKDDGFAVEESGDGDDSENLDDDDGESIDGDDA